jgi:hypothetical protein
MVDEIKFIQMHIKNVSDASVADRLANKIDLEIVEDISVSIVNFPYQVFNIDFSTKDHKSAVAIVEKAAKSVYPEAIIEYGSSPTVSIGYSSATEALERTPYQRKTVAMKGLYETDKLCAVIDGCGWAEVDNVIVKDHIFLEFDCIFEVKKHFSCDEKLGEMVNAALNNHLESVRLVDRGMVGGGNFDSGMALGSSVLDKTGAERFKMELDSKEKDQKAAEKGLSEAKKKVSSLNEAHSKELAAVETERSNAEQAIKGKSEAYDQQIKAIDDSISKLSQPRNTISKLQSDALKNKKTELEGQKTQLLNEKAGLSSQLDKVNADTANKINNLNSSHKSTVDKIVSEATSKVETAKQAVSNVQAKIKMEKNLANDSKIDEAKVKEYNREKKISENNRPTTSSSQKSYSTAQEQTIVQKPAFYKAISGSAKWVAKEIKEPTRVNMPWNGSSNKSPGASSSGSSNSYASGSSNGGNSSAPVSSSINANQSPANNGSDKKEGGEKVLNSFTNNSNTININSTNNSSSSSSSSVAASGNNSSVSDNKAGQSQTQASSPIISGSGKPQSSDGSSTSSVSSSPNNSSAANSLTGSSTPTPAPSNGVTTGSPVSGSFTPSDGSSSSGAGQSMPKQSQTSPVSSSSAGSVGSYSASSNNTDESSPSRDSNSPATSNQTIRAAYVSSFSSGENPNKVISSASSVSNSNNKSSTTPSSGYGSAPSSSSPDSSPTSGSSSSPGSSSSGSSGGGSGGSGGGSFTKSKTDPKTVAKLEAMKGTIGSGANTVLPSEQSPITRKGDGPSKANIGGPGMGLSNGSGNGESEGAIVPTGKLTKEDWEKYNSIRKGLKDDKDGNGESYESDSNSHDYSAAEDTVSEDQDSEDTVSTSEDDTISQSPTSDDQDHQSSDNDEEDYEDSFEYKPSSVSISGPKGQQFRLFARIDSEDGQLATGISYSWMKLAGEDFVAIDANDIEQLTKSNRNRPHSAILSFPCRNGESVGKVNLKITLDKVGDSIIFLDDPIEDGQIAVEGFSKTTLMRGLPVKSLKL